MIKINRIYIYTFLEIRFIVISWTEVGLQRTKFKMSPEQWLRSTSGLTVIFVYKASLTRSQNPADSAIEEWRFISVSDLSVTNYRNDWKYDI